MKIGESKTSKYIFYSLLIIIIVISLLPFFKIGFACADDILYYLVCKRDVAFEFSKSTAQYSGRFYFILTQAFYTFIYLIDNFFVRKLVQYLLLLLSYGLFANLTKRIFKIQNLDLFVFFVLVCFTTVPHADYHMPTIAYPGYFTASFSLLLFAIILFFKYLESEQYKYVIWSAVIFGIAILFYEVYVMFLLIFCVFILFRNINKFKSKILSSKQFYKEIIPFAICGVLYVTAYLLYRYFVYLPFGTEEAVYPGTMLAANFNFKNFFKLLWNLNQAAYPTKIFTMNQSLIIANSSITEDNFKNFWCILNGSNWIIILNSVFQTIVFVVLFVNIKINVSWKKLLFIATLSYLISFVPHVLIAIVEKYNSDIWLRGYVTTYFSYFFILFAILLLFLIIKQLSKTNVFLKNVVTILLSSIFFYACVITNFTNVSISKEWNKFNYPFSTIDKLKANNSFAEIPNDSIFYFPEQNDNSLFDSKVVSESFSWRNYIKYTTGRTLYVYKDIEELSTIKNKESRTIYVINHDSLSIVPVGYEKLVRELD